MSYECKKHNWSHLLKPCPDCFTYTTASNASDPGNENQQVKNLQSAVNYAKQVYTDLVMNGGPGPDLSTFEMTLDALSKGQDPKTYIEEAVKEIEHPEIKGTNWGWNR